MSTRRNLEIKRRNHRRRMIRLHKKVKNWVRKHCMKNSREYYDVYVRWSVRGHRFQRVRFREYATHRYWDVMQLLCLMSRDVVVKLPLSIFEGLHTNIETRQQEWARG